MREQKSEGKEQIIQDERRLQVKETPISPRETRGTGCQVTWRFFIPCTHVFRIHRPTIPTHLDTHTLDLFCAIHPQSWLKYSNCWFVAVGILGGINQENRVGQTISIVIFGRKFKSLLLTVPYLLLFGLGGLPELCIKLGIYHYHSHQYSFKMLS